MSLRLIPHETQFFQQPIIGQVEKVVTTNSIGRVKAMGSYWPARFYIKNETQSVFPDQWVKIIGIHGITLLIEPASQDDVPFPLAS